MTQWTNGRILELAQRQSALDANCCWEDFRRTENIVVLSRTDPGARRYLELPFSCHLISYGNNVVASVDVKYRNLVHTYIGRFRPEECFETPALHILNKALEQDGLQICFMAEYFLPDLDCLKQLDCPYKVRRMGPEDFTSLYKPEWGNALCEKRKHLDVLGMGAYDGDRLIGLAGCSADCETMWQIGIDVLPDYRRQGVAAALTSRLALAILEAEKVPFYCAAWSNVKSVRNAVKSGFRPAWVEITAKSMDYIDRLNGEEQR